MVTATRPRRVNLPVVFLGVVLAVLGFMSALLVAGGRPAAVAGVSGPGHAVVVAARDLSARTPLGRDALTTVTYSAADVPPGAVTKVDSAVGMLVTVDLRKGQPVLENLLVKSSEVIAGAQQPYLPLPKGYVGFTLPANEQQAVAGYIEAGDRVDLVAVVQPRSGGSANVRTVYTNVPVLRIGPAPDDTGAGTPAVIRRGGVTSSLTVAVNQCQAEYLSWLVANASLRFTLLSASDYKDRSDMSSDDQPCAGTPRVINDGDVRARWPGLL